MLVNVPPKNTQQRTTKNKRKTLMVIKLMTYIDCDFLDNQNSSRNSINLL